MKLTDTKPGLSGRHVALIVLAVVVLAGFGYLAYSVRKTAASDDYRVVAPTPAETAPPPIRTRGARRAPVVSPMTRSWSPPARPVPGTNDAAGAAPSGPPTLTRMHVRQAKAQLAHAADPCVEEALKRNPNLGMRMHIRYTLVVENGEARASNPQLARSELGDPATDRCILDRLRQVRWPTDAPNGSIAVGESFNFKHLKRTHISSE